jgi:hypothetical protein
MIDPDRPQELTLEQSLSVNQDPYIRRLVAHRETFRARRHSRLGTGSLATRSIMQGSFQGFKKVGHGLFLGLVMEPCVSHLLSPLVLTASNTSNLAGNSDETFRQINWLLAAQGWVLHAGESLLAFIMMRDWANPTLPQRGSKLQRIPYLLAYKTPLCGPCETNALSQGGY